MENKIAATRALGGHPEDDIDVFLEEQYLSYRRKSRASGFGLGQVSREENQACKESVIGVPSDQQGEELKEL
jgi:hypothetical protein